MCAYYSNRSQFPPAPPPYYIDPKYKKQPTPQIVSPLCIPDFEDRSIMACSKPLLALLRSIEATGGDSVKKANDNNNNLDSSLPQTYPPPFDANYFESLLIDPHRSPYTPIIQFISTPAWIKSILGQIQNFLENQTAENGNDTTYSIRYDNFKFIGTQLYDFLTIGLGGKHFILSRSDEITNISTMPIIFDAQRQLWENLLSSGFGWQTASKGTSLHQHAFASYQTLILQHTVIQVAKLNSEAMFSTKKRPFVSQIDPKVFYDQLVANLLKFTPHPLSNPCFDHYYHLTNIDSPNQITTSYLQQLQKQHQTNFENGDSKYVSLTLTPATTLPHRILNSILGFSIFVPPLPRFRSFDETILLGLLRTALRPPQPFVDSLVHSIKYPDTPIPTLAKITYRQYCIFWLFYSSQLAPLMNQFQIDNKQYQTPSTSDSTSGKSITWLFSGFCKDFPEYNIIHESFLWSMREICGKQRYDENDKVIKLTTMVTPVEAKSMTLDTYLRQLHTSLRKYQITQQDLDALKITDDTIFLFQNHEIHHIFSYIDYSTEYQTTCGEFCGAWPYPTNTQHITAESLIKQIFPLQSPSALTFPLPDPSTSPTQSTQPAPENIIRSLLKPSQFYRPIGLLFTALNGCPRTSLDDIVTLLQGLTIEETIRGTYEVNTIELISPSPFYFDPQTSVPFSGLVLSYNYNTSQKQPTSSQIPDPILETKFHHTISFSETTIPCEMLLFAILRRLSESTLTMLFNLIQDKSILVNINHVLELESFTPTKGITTSNLTMNDKILQTRLNLALCLEIAGTQYYAPEFVEFLVAHLQPLGFKLLQ